MAISTAAANLPGDAHYLTELEQDARREKRQLFALCTPGLLLTMLLLFLPIGWLFWFSFIDADGNPTFEHYSRIWTEGAYVQIFVITFQISILVTVICVLLGYPVAYCLSQLPAKWSGLLLIGILLPFWTSLLVRTYAWLVLLQRRGIVNDTLIDLGIVQQPLPLMHNMTGTIIGMVHIMIPFLVLPLYASMKSIDGSYLRAAANLGASPTRAFWEIYLPLSLPGLLAGLVLTFILCLGFYITPAVLGGGRVQMIAQRIEASVHLYPTWGPASALGAVLLLLTTLILLASHLLLGRWRRRLG
ncbi:ABC transporter permease [Dongia soli]|uniref:ABC transporter permease n=1 Tax=Dongia soli TaxID=600628 RepID=A0ABU5EBL1_9PROT|nr:ABC transporter permease [Dongia soli]MDY0883767.1 ABC transporter permease [Dongia soli]